MVHSPPWRVWPWRVSPPGRYYGGGGSTEEGLWQGPFGPSHNPFFRQLRLLIPLEGGRPSSRAVSGSLRTPGLSITSERSARSMGTEWFYGDCSRCRPWTTYEARTGSAYSARGIGGTHGFGWSHGELSTIRGVIQREESLPRALSYGPLGMVLFFHLLAQAAELLDTNFLDGLDWVALPEMTPMEVSPGPREQGRPVEEPASSSLETIRTTYCHRCGGGSVSEQARQVAPALAATAQRSRLDMAGVSLDQTMSSATGWRLTVEGAVSSDYCGSQCAGQLSVMKLAAAMRHPALAPRPTTGDNVRWGP